MFEYGDKYLCCILFAESKKMWIINNVAGMCSPSATTELSKLKRFVSGVR